MVRFIGYGDTQSVWPKDLMESLGKEARDKQVEEALKDVGNVKATEPLDQNGNVSRSPQ